MRRVAWVGAGAVLLALFAAGWRSDSAAMLAAYLAAWWCWTGILLGGLANVWLHNLTGGNWGEAIRPVLLRRARALWFAALLFVPVLLSLPALYPWAGGAGWAATLSEPDFKRAWLAPWPFVIRSAAYLGLWCALAQLSQRAALQRSQPFSALALVLYGCSVSLAAVDWVMSLMPLWYSSIFGLVAGSAQMLGGMALGTLAVTRASVRPDPCLLRDLGNLLLMYVMTLAYLAFMQFLIIWGANLPHEIAWYVPRYQGVWPLVAVLLAGGLFGAPLLIMLFRPAKQAPVLLGALAAALLAMLMLHAWWLVLPSLAVPAAHWLWAAPLGLLTVGAAFLLQARWREVSHG